MSRRSLLLVCCALLGLAPGCAKRSYAESSAPPSPDYDGGSGGDTAMAGAAPAPSGGMAVYDFAEDEAPQLSKKDYREVDPDGGVMPTGANAAPARPAPVARPEPKGELAPDKGKLAEPGDGKAKPADPEPQKFARQIIYTAEMQLSVYKLDDAMQRAEELTLAVGGYVQNMSQGYYVLRIPAPALRGVMEDLARLGVVEARMLQARDVSEEYVDLTTRIRVLRETQAQLLALLKQARNVEEALKVRASLDAITMELEQAMGRLRLLESLIGFSTLTVRMSQRGPQNAIPSSNDPFPWVDDLGVESTEWN